MNKIRRKGPERMCVSCRRKSIKKSLIRIVKNKSGEFSVDLSGGLPGRGAYIHADSKCLEFAVKKKSLERALKCRLSEEFYGLLESRIGERIE